MLRVQGLGFRVQGSRLMFCLGFSEGLPWRTLMSCNRQVLLPSCGSSTAPGRMSPICTFSLVQFNSAQEWQLTGCHSGSSPAPDRMSPICTFRVQFSLIQLSLVQDWLLMSCPLNDLTRYSATQQVSFASIARLFYLSTRSLLLLRAYLKPIQRLDARQRHVVGRFYPHSHYICYICTVYSHYSRALLPPYNHYSRALLPPYIPHRHTERRGERVRGRESE